jgi:hypothetical protein
MNHLADLQRELLSIIKALSPSKIEIIRVNISSSFLPRARCKKCGKGPSFYYFRRKSALLKSPLREATKRWLKRMTADWYLTESPKDFDHIEDFSFRLFDKSYRPVMHKTRGFSTGKDHIVEALSCDCGHAVWLFNHKSVKNRPEIRNRKGRYGYPQKFEGYDVEFA